MACFPIITPVYGGLLLDFQIPAGHLRAAVRNSRQRDPGCRDRPQALYLCAGSVLMPVPSRGCFAPAALRKGHLLILSK